MLNIIRIIIILLLFNYVPRCFSQSSLLKNFTPPETIKIGEITVLDVPAKADVRMIQMVINKAINISAKDKTVRIQFASKGIYRLSGSPGKKPLLNISSKEKKVYNLEFDGRGCSFVITSWTKFIVVSKASNMILKNFKLTWEPNNISQGKIVAIHDQIKGYYDIEIDKDHPLINTPRFNTSDLRWIIFMKKYNDGTFGFKPGCPTTFTYKYPNMPKHLGGRRFRIRILSVTDHGRLHGPYEDDPIRKRIGLGDRMAFLSRSNGRGCFYTTLCHTLVFRNILITHSPAAAFCDHFSERTCWINVKIQQEPGHLFTTTADGIYVTCQRNGPWIENCVLRGIGDDGIVIKNTVGFYKGASSDSKHPYIVGAHKKWFSVLPGDRICFFDMKSRKFLGLNKITGVSSVFPWKDKNVSFDKNIAILPNTKNVWMYHLNNQGNGFVIKNNKVIDNRRWGILCGGANGSIISNTFLRSQNSAIYLVNSDNYMKNLSGAPPRNIEIRNNIFIDNWHAANANPYGVIASRINGGIKETRNEDSEGTYGTDWNGIENIIISGNIFKEWYTTASTFVTSRGTEIENNPVHAVYLRDIKNVTVSDNTFIYRKPLHINARAIKVNDYDGLIIGGNVFKSWPGGEKSAVHISGEK